MVVSALSALFSLLCVPCLALPTQPALSGPAERHGEYIHFAGIVFAITGLTAVRKSAAPAEARLGASEPGFGEVLKSRNLGGTSLEAC